METAQYIGSISVIGRYFRFFSLIGIGCYWVLNWPFAKTPHPPPLVTVAMSDKPCRSHTHITFSRSEKYIAEQRGHWQCGRQTRQSRLLLVWNKVSAFNIWNFVRNSNKYCFVALYCVLTYHCSASVQSAREPIISSSLLVITK